MRAPGSRLSQGPEDFERMFGKKNLETAASPEEFLRAVDFNVLNKILALIARKSGSQKEFNPLHPDDFTFVEPMTVSGDKVSGRIEMAGGHDYRTGKSSVAWKKYDNQRHTNLTALANLIHESVHRIAAPEESDMEHLAPDYPDNLHPGQVTTRIKRGYVEVQKKTETIGVKRNVSFDEAVTESIALQVFNMYIHQTGDSKLLDAESKDKVNAGYIYDRVLLNVLIEALARRLDIEDRDRIWRGFIQGYFEQKVKTRALLDMVYEELLSSNPVVVNTALRLEGAEAIDERRDQVNVFARLSSNEFQREKLKKALDRVVETLDKSYIENALGLS